MSITPLETRYAGCRFRSRLEARWAVLFNALRIRWEYEPQGFQTEAGPYLPDFRLYGLGGDGFGKPYLWFEVKPDVGDRAADPRWLAVAVDAPLIVAYGMPRPDDDLIWGSSSSNGWMELYDTYVVEDDVASGGWDNGRAFGVCRSCGRLGITFEGISERICWHPSDASESFPLKSRVDEKALLNAYAAAHSARFEHGEQG